MQKLLILASLLVAIPAAAELGTFVPGAVAVQTAVPLNGSQAARTSAAMKVEGFQLLRLTYAYTRVAGTDFEVHCETAETSTGPTWRHLDPANSDREFQAGEPVYSYAALTSSRTFDVRIGVAGFRWIRCYPTVAAAGATDLVTTTFALFN